MIKIKLTIQLDIRCGHCNVGVFFFFSYRGCLNFEICSRVLFLKLSNWKICTEMMSIFQGSRNVLEKTCDPLTTFYSCLHWRKELVNSEEDISGPVNSDTSSHLKDCRYVTCCHRPPANPAVKISKQHTRSQKNGEYIPIRLATPDCISHTHGCHWMKSKRICMKIITWTPIWFTSLKFMSIYLLLLSPNI